MGAISPENHYSADPAGPAECGGLSRAVGRIRHRGIHDLDLCTRFESVNGAFGQTAAVAGHDHPGGAALHSPDHRSPQGPYLRGVRHG